MNSCQLTTVKKTRKSPRVGRDIEIVENLDSTWELKKATETLTIRNISSNEITFLVRKAYNAMLQVAQKEIAKTGNEEQITFVCPLKELEGLVGHSTPNSRDHLKQVLRQVGSYQVEFDYQGQFQGRKKEQVWSVASMVSEVQIFEESQIVQFSFPPALKKQMLNPQMYNLMDMRMQNKVTCHSALALYEIVSRYFTSPSLTTFKAHWSNWSMLLSGSSQPHASFRDFNKMLKRAIDQVTEHEPRYLVRPHITKLDRKYDTLWFIIEKIQQAPLDLDTVSDMVGKDVQQVLQELGFKEEIAEIVIKYDEEYILAQADFVKRRQGKKGAEPIASPTRYFMKALEENYADAPRISSVKVGTHEKRSKKALNAPKPDASAQKKSKIDSLKEKWKAAKVDQVKAEYLSLPDSEQLERIRMVEPYLINTPIWSTFKKNGLKSATVSSTIFQKLFELTVPVPTTDDLLEFAVEQATL